MADIPIGTIQTDAILIERLFDVLNRMVGYNKIYGRYGVSPEKLRFPTGGDQTISV